MDTQKTIYNPTVLDFIAVAAELCKKLESNELTDKTEFKTILTRILPLLYVKATLLPNIEEDFDNLQEYVSEEDYNYVQNRVWNILKEEDEYLEVFCEEMQFNETPVVKTISENISDIYQDIKNFLATYADENEECMLAALSKIQYNFKTYWGQSLVNVMRPLHQNLYNEKQFD